MPSKSGQHVVRGMPVPNKRVVSANFIFKETSKFFLIDVVSNLACGAIEIQYGPAFIMRFPPALIFIRQTQSNVEQASVTIQLIEGVVTVAHVFHISSFL